MTICTTCGDYFRTNAWHNDKHVCQNCYFTVPTVEEDEDYQIEKNHLLNPSGKTPAIFYDERDDSYGL